jgi:hypothetical protein
LPYHMWQRSNVTRGMKSKRSRAPIPLKPSSCRSIREVTRTLWSQRCRYLCNPHRYRLSDLHRRSEEVKDIM